MENSASEFRLRRRSLKRHSLAARVCGVVAGLPRVPGVVGRIDHPEEGGAFAKSATVASGASSVPGQPCKTTAYRHVILVVQAR